MFTGLRHGILSQADECADGKGAGAVPPDIASGCNELAKRLLSPDDTGLACLQDGESRQGGPAFMAIGGAPSIIGSAGERKFPAKNDLSSAIPLSPH